MADFKGLLHAIREACTPATWSRGVALARVGAVTLEGEGEGEARFRVGSQGTKAAVPVSLFLEECDWSCTCKSTEDACAHAAASAIAWSQGLSKDTPSARRGAAPGRVAYELSGRSGRLALQRVLVSGDTRTPLEGSLGLAAKRQALTTTEADLLFERELGSFAGGVVNPQSMGKVLRALKGVEHLTLDGLPAHIGPPSCGLVLRVQESPDGYVVRLEQDNTIDQIYENAAFRRAQTIYPVGPHGLREGDFMALRKGKIFSLAEMGTLVGDVLPRLRKHVPVVIDGRDLPGAKSIRPRLSVLSEHTDDGLQLLATIVYGDPPVARIDGDTLTMLRGDDIPLRNVRLEKLLIRRLESFDLRPGIRAVFPVAKGIDVIAAVQGEAMLEGDDIKVVGGLRPKIDVQADGSFSLSFFVDDAPGTRVDAASVVAAWRRGDSFAPIVGGGFGRIPLAWLSEQGHRVAALLAAREGTAASSARVPAWAGDDMRALYASLDEPPPPNLEQLQALLPDYKGLPTPSLPDDVDAALRDYQLEGVAWLHFLRKVQLGALLADDMGLGKTLQTLCAMGKKTLVVAPTSVMQNWASEASKFRPGLTVHTYHGSSRSLEPHADVTLTTYAVLRLDIDALSKTSWDMVVLDESQAIKNPDSQVARAAYRLNAPFRVALTGTPVENRLEDLWSQMHFLNPGLLGGRSDFTDMFVRPIAAGDANTAKRLRARIRPVVLRRLKSEVARELPPRTDVVLRCELGPEERAVYDTVRAATQETVLAQLGAGANVLSLLEALLRLRQAACHPALVPGQAAAFGARGPFASAKIELLFETLEEALSEGHKALVFSQWTSLLDLVEPHLRGRSIAFERLDGSTRDRAGVVGRFQDEKGPPVMLLSLKAGGTGLNLTAADHVFLLDPWWNPAVEDQAADRAHRIGQDRPVLVHRLVAKDTVEERILELQVHKRKLAETAVGDAASAMSITREQLLALLQ